MENLDDVSVSEGINTVTIILSDESNKRVLNNNCLKWLLGEEGQRSITLREIYQQLKHKDYRGVIYVWEETPLSGTIYQCGNYQDGQWIKHGTTRGYA